ncbi:hypothetical protein [Pseudomonas sp. Root562]|uniref:hypothetical protein n=1 Tax=Pseudomonas sp. Root562 TaxID=1736561 RepID=UPI0007023D19|nr:hypothetical protein [Pseudomonas sp. Root562]KQZ92860.1 hypothetical protein ASD60_21265 [Pseudomonas sp. Root562]
MCDSLKYKAYQLSGSVSDVQCEWLKADAAERQLVLQQLKTVFDEQEDEGPYDWQGYEFPLVTGSSLYEVHMPGRVAWNNLANHTSVMDELRRLRLESMALTRINATGVLEIYRKSTTTWEAVDLELIQASHNYQKLLVIGDIASQAGGYVYTEDYTFVDQWLEFHGLAVPRNASETRNLIALFEFDPEVDELGNYWRQLAADDPSLIVLSAEQHAAIRQATAKLIAPDKKLLDKLYRETSGTLATHDNAAECIVQLVRHPAAQTCARNLLKELDWFGATSGQDVSAQDLGQLLITAILLELYPDFGKAQGRKSIGGFDLYSPTNVERSSLNVRKELETFLHTKGWVNPVLAPMASHLLLAEIAPEFLVKGVPSSLTMGSVAWVVFCRGVALVEAVTKGAALVLSYGQIMAYVELEPVSSPLSRLRDLAMIDPIVDWALLNGVIEPTELTQAAKETTERAIAAFEAYTEHFTHLARVLSNPLPSREDIARKALEDVAPGCDFLDRKVIYQRPGLYASPTAMSMVDLHMSGDLASGEWDLRAVFPDDTTTTDLLAGMTHYTRPTFHDPSVLSIYKRFPLLSYLAPNNVEFHRQLRGYLGNLNSAVVTNVKLALSHMLPFDLEIFLKGKITFFTLRGAAVEISSRYIGGPLTYETDYETQQGKDAVTGRFGVVMYAIHENSVACYELFTFRGELRKNDVLGNLITSKGKCSGRSRIDFIGDLNAQVAPTPLEALPVTLKEYTEGVAVEQHARSDLAIIEKLGELPAPRSVVARTQSIYMNFGNPQFARIAEFVVSHHPFRKFSEVEAMATVPTALESQRKMGNETADYIVNLVVPFKKCIEDLSSGDHNRVVDGIYGCAMDAIALGGAFAGAAAKALSISSKAVSLSSKAAQLTKLAFVTSVSLINPLDGVPTALFGAGKLVHKGALRFNRQAQEMLGLAQSQLQKLNGRHKTYDLIRAANRADTTGQGTWRPLGATGDTLTVVAARNAHQWYALDRLGKPWGPRLNNFMFESPIQLPRFNKTLPVSYTRQFIEQSLPLARTKIENAINVLNSLDLTRERDAIIKVLMGSNSSDAFERLLSYLRLVRADFAGLSISNMFLDPLKTTHNIAALNKEAYEQWKGAQDPSNTQFIEIYTPQLNKHFISLGFNHDVVADDLIHELFHGASQTDDVSYARDAGRNGERGQLLDVAALLNLASGRLPVTDEGDACHASAKTFENADSLAVTTSLLSQLYTDRNAYERNMSILRGAVEANAGRVIDQPVLITLNSSLASKPAGGTRPPGSHMD